MPSGVGLQYRCAAPGLACWAKLRLVVSWCPTSELACWATFRSTGRLLVHIRIPPGRSALPTHFREPFTNRIDFSSWAAGVADTVRSILKRESIIELFGDVKLLGGASAFLDAVNDEHRTHRRDSSGILGDTGAVEGKLFLSAVAPWLAIAALVVDPFLHAQHRQGIMDVAGETGRAAVRTVPSAVPRDRGRIHLVGEVRVRSGLSQRAAHLEQLPIPQSRISVWGIHWTISQDPPAHQDPSDCLSTKDRLVGPRSGHPQGWPAEDKKGLEDFIEEKKPADTVQATKAFKAAVETR